MKGGSSVPLVTLYEIDVTRICRMIPFKRKKDASVLEVPPINHHIFVFETVSSSTL